MPKRYKRIPIDLAKRIAKEFDKDQVIILTLDKTWALQSVTTYGKTFKDCVNAAEGGNRIKKALGWPEEECHAKPARQKRKEAKKRG